MSDQYLLRGQPSELERLRLQSLVWEPASRILFGTIPVRPGWKCLDVGCGAIGVLRPLSEAAGPTGSVLGVDVDAKLLASAEAFVAENHLANVETSRADIFNQDDLPAAAFDLVHLRFMLAPIGREQELIASALRLCREGGVLVVQEPVADCWSTIPPTPAHDRLRDIILAAFHAGGGDFNAGRRTFELLRSAGLQDVQIRAAVEALSPGHPYLKVGQQFTTSLRQRIVDSSIATPEELDALNENLDKVLSSPETAGLTFLVTQVWGVKATVPA